MQKIDYFMLGQMTSEITPTSDLFTQTDIMCPKKCGTRLNKLNGMFICETCGWYLVKINDRLGGIKIVRDGEICFNKPHIRPLGKQYLQEKLKLLNNPR